VVVVVLVSVRHEGLIAEAEVEHSSERTSLDSELMPDTIDEIEDWSLER
jgi:outer membrane biosynthesis protein TonB